MFAGEFHLSVTLYFVHPRIFRIRSVKEGLMFSRNSASQL
jgi:hypothetical protein